MVLKINEEIFRSYDIRGVGGVDLDYDIVKLIGKGFGTYLLERKEKDVLVGHDNRPTTKNITGRLSTG